jgi:hypothetical protein
VDQGDGWERQLRNKREYQGRKEFFRNHIIIVTMLVPTVVGIAREGGEIAD